MYDRRMKLALRLALFNPDTTGSDAREAGFDTRTHPVWDAGIVDTCTDMIEQVLNRHFQAQQDTFPYGQVELLLRAVVEAESGQEQGISDKALAHFLDRLQPMLAEWTEAGHGAVEAPLAKALRKAAADAFETTFDMWHERLGLDLKPTPEMRAGLGKWAERRVAELAAQVGETTGKQIAGIITDGIQKGLSVREIMLSIRKYLRDTSRIADRVETIARTEASEAVNRSMFDANRLLGATGKRWGCQKDRSVCDACLRNDDEGPIPIEETFLSGHRRPPAHPRCRCIVVYFGVTRESLVQAVGLV